MLLTPAHRFDFRVYYEDTDAGGVVYYANYLKFAERARTEALRSFGIQQSALLKEHGIAFVVRRVEAEFLKPARLDDRLTIATRLEDSRRVSLRMQQHILRGEEVLFVSAVKLGVVGRDFSPAPLPSHVRAALETLRV